MTVRLICGDRVVARVSRELFERSVFNNQNIPAADPYTLQCRASFQIVNVLLNWIEGMSQGVTITEDNFEELQNLCEELGFRGLDEELRAFRRGTGSNPVESNEVLQLKERIARQEKRLVELERQLSQVLSRNREMESDSQEAARQFQALARRIEEVARVCEERIVKAWQKAELALDKGKELQALAQHMLKLQKDLKQAETKPAPPALRRGEEFVCKDSNKLDGIIAHLTQRFGGNVHDKGIVHVTASSAQRLSAPKWLVDPSYHEFRSHERPNSWICLEFKERRVIPTSYSMQSSDYCHPMSWVVEVSNDETGGCWTEIDRRDKSIDLLTNGVIVNFKISHVPSEGVRYFRLTQIANDRGTGKIVLLGLEIFGTLYEIH